MCGLILGWLGVNYFHYSLVLSNFLLVLYGMVLVCILVSLSSAVQNLCSSSGITNLVINILWCGVYFFVFFMVAFLLSYCFISTLHCMEYGLNSWSFSSGDLHSVHNVSVGNNNYLANSLHNISVLSDDVLVDNGHNISATSSQLRHELSANDAVSGLLRPLSPFEFVPFNLSQLGFSPQRCSSPVPELGLSSTLEASILYVCKLNSYMLFPSMDNSLYFLFKEWLYHGTVMKMGKFFSTGMFYTVSFNGMGLPVLLTPGNPYVLSIVSFYLPSCMKTVVFSVVMGVMLRNMK